MLLSAGALAAASGACQGEIDSPAGPAPNPGPGVTTQHGAFPSDPPLVTASLAVAGDQLSLAVVNGSDSAAEVSLSAVISNPGGLYLTEDAGKLTVGARRTVTVPLSAATVRGLHVRDDAWTNARVSYEYHLADGRLGGMPVSIFADHGVAAAPHDVVASGHAEGFPEMEPQVELAAAGAASDPNVTFCFAHVATYSGVFESNLDNHRGTTQQVFSSFNALESAIVTPPGGSSQLIAAGQRLDVNGCITLRRVLGNWTFRLPLFIANLFDSTAAPQNFITTKRLDGSNPTAVVTVNLTASTGNPARALYTLPAGQDAELQAALTLVIHTIQRVASFYPGALGHRALTIQMSSSGLADYTSNVVNVTQSSGTTPGSAIKRRVVAHETGHWIEDGFLNLNNVRLDYTYCTPNTQIASLNEPNCTVPPDDGCGRTPAQGTHVFLGVEWASSAHIEGFANFIAGLSYNNLFSGADCFLPDITDSSGNFVTSTFSCESVGLALKTGGPTMRQQCFEWAGLPSFGAANVLVFRDVGTEMDWAKLYWDLFADTSANLTTYLTGEKSQTGWNRANHYDKIVAGLAGSPEQALFQAAAPGNIFDGAAH